MQYATNVSLWKRLLDVLSVGLEYFLALALNTKSLKTSLPLGWRLLMWVSLSAEEEFVIKCSFHNSLFALCEFCNRCYGFWSLSHIQQPGLEPMSPIY